MSNALTVNMYKVLGNLVEGGEREKPRMSCNHANAEFRDEQVVILVLRLQAPSQWLLQKDSLRLSGNGWAAARAIRV